MGPIWTFSLRDVLTFVASGLDINVCVLSYFEGTVNLHCYTSCTPTTLHCSKVSFLQCCPMQRYNQIFAVRGVLTFVTLYIKGPMACYFMDAYIYIYYICVGGPLIQYLKTFNLGSELQPIQASPTAVYLL